MVHTCRRVYRVHTCTCRRVYRVHRRVYRVHTCRRVYWVQHVHVYVGGCTGYIGGCTRYIHAGGCTRYSDLQKQPRENIFGQS